MEDFRDILKVEGVTSKGYGIIGKLAMLDKRLTIEAKAIYSYFCSYAGAGSTAFPGINKILDDLCISKNRYYKHFNLLKQYDYIQVDQVTKSSGQFSHNVYILVQNPNFEPLLQNRDTANEPCTQIEETVERPILQNEDTGQKTFPCLHFPYTENEDTIINSSSLKLKDIYKDLSFYLSNIDILPKDIQQQLTQLLDMKEKERVKDGVKENSPKSIKDNEFMWILEKAQLQYCEDPLAVEQALRLLYFGTKPLKINDMNVPPSQVREDLQKITIDAINTGFDDFNAQSKLQQIRNPVVYLSRCIYNAIWHSKIQITAAMNYEGLVLNDDPMVLKKSI